LVVVVVVLYKFEIVSHYCCGCHAQNRHCLSTRSVWFSDRTNPLYQMVVFYIASRHW